MHFCHPDPACYCQLMLTLVNSNSRSLVFSGLPLYSLIMRKVDQIYWSMKKAHQAHINNISTKCNQNLIMLSLEMAWTRFFYKNVAFFWSMQKAYLPHKNNVLTKFYRNQSMPSEVMARTIFFKKMLPHSKGSGLNSWSMQNANYMGNLPAKFCQNPIMRSGFFFILRRMGQNNWTTSKAHLPHINNVST